MSDPMVLGDIPEILAMVAKYLGTNTLVNAVRVSRQWHRHLLPELWSWMQLYPYDTRFGLAGPQFLPSFAEYGHFLRVLCIDDVKSLDMFRPRPNHLQGHDNCLVKNLTYLGLVDDLMDSRDMEGDKEMSEEETHRLIGLILIARADYEKMNDILNQIAIDSSSKKDGGQITRLLLNVGGDYYTPELLPPVEDDEIFDEHWNRSVDALVHPNYFDPLMHLLRHNRHLCSLTVHHFPSWSQQAITAICREGLPLLQELDLGSQRSAMVSTRLMKILLEGLTPKLRKLNIWISFLHDDENPRTWTAKELEKFWHLRYRQRGCDPKTTCDPIDPSSDEELDLELAERHELKELSIDQPYSSENHSRIEQEGALRSLVPFLRRCRQLEQLKLKKLPQYGPAMKELTATLYDFCPLLTAFEVIDSHQKPHEAIPDHCFGQVLLASRGGWKNIDLSPVRHLSRFSIDAFMGTADSKDLATTRRQMPLKWTSYPPSVIERRLAEFQGQFQRQEAAGASKVTVGTITNTSLREPRFMDYVRKVIIRPRLQILETLNIAGCSKVESQSIQTILCSCPVLKKFVAITNGIDASMNDPYLRVEDMATSVDSLYCTFWSSTNAEEEDNYCQKPKWACQGLEVLCLKIELSARPDTRLEVIRTPKKHRDHVKTKSQTLLDIRAMESCREEQSLIYRELGRLNRLRKLRLGHCYSSFQWEKRGYHPAVCDFLDTSSLDLGHGAVTENIGSPAIAEEALLTSLSHSQSSTSCAKTAVVTNHSGSCSSRTIVNAGVYQRQSLEFSLASGLELMLQGTPRLEILELPQMATRIGLKEVQAMVTAWPKLRRLGLRSFTEINWKEEEVDDDTDDTLDYGILTTVPRPRFMSDDLLPRLLECIYYDEASALGQSKLVEHRDMILGACLDWLRQHHPDIDVQGAKGDKELEVEPTKDDEWERWDN